MTGCVKAYIMLRYPNGKRKQKTFPAEATILVGIKFGKVELSILPETPCTV